MLTFSLTLLPKIVSFLFLTAILALYLKRKSLPSVLVRLGITAAVIFFAYSGFSKTLFTYVAWSQDGFSKHFLPPYTPISYFVNYSFFRFALGYIIAVAMALLIFGFLIFLKKKRPVLLDKEDASLAAFGALVSGWPGLLVYFPLALLLMVFWHLFATLSPSLRGAPAEAASGSVAGDAAQNYNNNFERASLNFLKVEREAISPSASPEVVPPPGFGGPTSQNSDSAVIPVSSDDNQEIRIPITVFIFIAAFITLFFSSYILKYLGLEVLIVAKSSQ